MHLTDFTRRADEIIALADKVLSTFLPSAYGIDYDRQAYSTFRSAGLSFLVNTFGAQHPYYKEFDECTKEVYVSSTVQAGRGILLAAKDEVAGGWAVSTRGIVSAEIFGDFMEMAQHLLAEQYKDPAAVMAGSVLEEHLRQLANKHGVAIDFVDSKGKTVPKKADVLNADLVKAGVYNVLNQKLVTGWLDLRNKAAHGKYAEYREDHVNLMIQGILQFMTL
jgi:hypothetical protein